MQTNAHSAQLEHEQRAVDAMYARLDAEIDDRLAKRAATMATPVEGPQDRHVREVEIARLVDDVDRLRSAERSLCFGRIDTNEEPAESLHIGRIGVRSDDDRILLVDWRAPAARPFYAATPAHPAGVRRRRHLRVDGRAVVEVTDEILDGSIPSDADVVGDDPLTSALNGARTGRMRDAAATLQREQDEIVRSEDRGIMVVDGGPGTGKTIVALHRAAYVLYAFPSIGARGVLVFGPNRRFLAYISAVLPSLGENDVELATLSDLIRTGSSDTGVSGSESERVARSKGRAQFAAGLARWVRAREPDGASLSFRFDDADVVLDSARVDAARRAALQDGVGHNRARELFTAYVIDELVDQMEQQTARDIAEFEDEIKDVLGIDLDRMFASDTGPTGSGDSASSEELEIDWDRVRDELLEDPDIDQVIGEVWPRLDAEEVVRGLLTDHAALAEVLGDCGADEIAAITGSGHTGWSTADLALLDEARALIDGLPAVTYGHIVVDEAQQLSEMQWRVLMRRCPNRSMTVVGDLAQAGPSTTVRSWDTALEPFVGDRFVHHTLTVNYRTTAQILEASGPALARIAPGQPLSRSIRDGERPTVIPVAAADVDSTVIETVAALRTERPDDLIGVVACVPRIDGLDALIGGTGATLVPAPDARGLEFDTVLIVAPHEIEMSGEAGLRDLYVAQTRATQRVVTLVVHAAETGNDQV